MAQETVREELKHKGYGMGEYMGAVEEGLSPSSMLGLRSILGMNDSSRDQKVANLLLAEILKSSKRVENLLLTLITESAPGEAVSKKK